MSAVTFTPGQLVTPVVTVYLVTREKFAHEVGLSVDVVSGWIDRGYVPTVKLGKYRLINLLLLNRQLLESDRN